MSDERLDVIRYKIGDDAPRAWELTEADGDALAAGNYGVQAQVRAYYGGPVLHEWSTTNHRAEIVSTGSGLAEDPLVWWVQLLVDDSRTWTWQRGLFDVYLTDPQGRSQPVIPRGVWINEGAVTDDGT